MSSHAPLSRVPLVVLVSALAASCYSTDPKEEDEEGFAAYREMDIPEEVQSRSTAIAFRVTDAYPGEIPVNRSIVNIFEELDIVDMLTRGGVPEGGVGAGGANSNPGAHADLLAGTSVEQVRAYYERVGVDEAGLFPVEEAVDDCGNPVVAAFIPPSQVQHAALGADPSTLPIWPLDCGTDPDCNTLEIGTLDAYVSSTRPDGKFDMVINLLPDTSTNPPAPGLFGHMIGYFPSVNNAGFTEVPMVVNARQFTVSLNNLWERQKVYTDLVGSRELYAFPGSERVVFGDELIVLTAGNQPDWCSALWAAGFTGVEPLGCPSASGLLLDRNPPTGADVYSTYMENGNDEANLRQIVSAFEYAMRAYAACPAVPDEPLYVQDGPVEFFICPPESSTVELCVAEVDMEQGVCEPRVGGTVEVMPLMQSEPVPLTPQRFPYVLVQTGLIGPGKTTTTTDSADTGDTGTTDTGITLPKTKKKEPFTPFVGTEVEVELTVEADTVLFLQDASVVTLTDASGQPVELPEPRLPCDKGNDTPRYDVGEAWGPGTYTLTMAWSPVAPNYQIGLTNIPAWVW